MSEPKHVDSNITAETHACYYSGAARRRYFSLISAATAEARMRIRKKYPSERGDRESGEPGWCAEQMPQYARMLKRYANLIIKAYKKENLTP